jgi:ribonuclease VapC
MVVEASALAAVFFMEPDGPIFLRALEQTQYACLSAANFLDVAIVIDNLGMTEQMVDLDLFLAEAGVEIVPVSAGHARIARDAYRRFGRGNHLAGRPQLRRLQAQRA